VSAARRTDQITFGQALNAGMRSAMEDDPKVLLIGEDIGRLGGVFRVTDGLQKDFGEHRVVDSPLGEAGIVGTAIGLALRGYRPVCEIQFDGFVFPAYDQIVTQLARMRYRSAGRLSVPVVVRVPFGGGIGSIEHHSESPEALFTHVPGLTVVAPSNPVDAYWMMREAVRIADPVIFFEPKRLYWQKAPRALVDAEAARAREDADSGGTPLRRAAVVRPGRDLTLVGYGPTVGTCLAAATAAAEDGAELEVVDLRSLSPLDMSTVLASVRRTRRAVLVHEAPRSGGLGAEISARISEQCFDLLEAPVGRVTGYDVPYPVGRLEDHHLPDVDRVLDAVDTALSR
jgi:2-oxoisovalerate dehydrogenase E1 component beta subunit